MRIGIVPDDGSCRSAGTSITEHTKPAGTCVAQVVKSAKASCPVRRCSGSPRDGERRAGPGRCPDESGEPDQRGVCSIHDGPQRSTALKCPETASTRPARGRGCRPTAHRPVSCPPSARRGHWRRCATARAGRNQQSFRRSRCRAPCGGRRCTGRRLRHGRRTPPRRHRVRRWRTLRRARPHSVRSSGGAPVNPVAV